MPSILNSLRENFCDLGFTLADQDGDAYGVHVLSVDKPETYLISLYPGEDDELAKAHFELTTSIHYAAKSRTTTWIRPPMIAKTRC
jgi:hypothetical protein